MSAALFTGFITHFDHGLTFASAIRITDLQITSGGVSDHGIG
jgi:hypothetical protein